jgi:MFS family permease
MDGLLRWFGQRAGEFGPEAHPWLPVAQHLHVLTAPLLLFALGMVVRGHLQIKLKKGPEGRRTGLGAAFLIAPMVLSGYAVQVVTSPAWRTGFSWAHGIGAGLFLLAYLGHLFIPHSRSEEAGERMVQITR